MEQLSGQHVLVINATVGGLTLGALDRYLADMRAWVLAHCRVALESGTASGRIGKIPGAVMDALIAAGGGTTGDVARFLRYDADAPHVALARQLGLSSTATAILVLSAAPQLWGDVAQLYAKIGFTNRAIAEARLLAALLNVDVATIMRELGHGTHLSLTGAWFCGKVHPLILRRLAGEKFLDARAA
jgi:hypothetical protein